MYDILLFITLVFGFTLLLSFFKRISKDNCLKNFSGDHVQINSIDGKSFRGSLYVENTGIELSYLQSTSGIGSSYILYKQEYPLIATIIRFSDELNAEAKRKREKVINQIYRPSLPHRIKRYFMNIIKAARDGLVEIISLFLGYAKKSSPIGRAIDTQQKHAKQIGEEVINFIGTAYEPLLENHIGHKMIVQLTLGKDHVETHEGILSEYTTDFITLLDVEYKEKDSDSTHKCDLIVNRDHGKVRHRGID